MTTETELPSGYTECASCGGTGLSQRTAEPIARLMGRKGEDGLPIPDFVPLPLPCSDCSQRAMGVEPYSIWHAGRWQ